MYLELAESFLNACQCFLKFFNCLGSKVHRLEESPEFDEVFLLGILDYELSNFNLEL